MPNWPADRWRNIQKMPYVKSVDAPKFESRELTFLNGWLHPMRQGGARARTVGMDERQQCRFTGRDGDAAGRRPARRDFAGLAGLGGVLPQTSPAGNASRQPHDG